MDVVLLMPWMATFGHPGDWRNADADLNGQFKGTKIHEDPQTLVVVH